MIQKLKQISWKKYKVLIIILGVILFLGICFLVLYAVNSQKTTFPKNTYIEQVDVSGATAKEAAQKIANDFNKKEFKIVEINNTSKVLGTLTNFGFQYQLEDKIEPKLVWANMLSTFTSIYNGNVNLSADVVPDNVTKSMISQIKNMDFVNDPKIVHTRNAYVDKSSTDFPIVPEVYGTSVDVEKLGKAIVDKIGSKEWQLEYEASQFYEQPTVKKDSADLVTLQKYCQKNLTQKITYDFCDSTYTLSVEELDKLLVQKGESSQINKEGVTEFVSSLAGKCNSIGATRKFKSAKSGTVSVGGGTYGFALSQDGEIEQLTQDLLSHKNVEREPVYAQKGVSGKGNYDIGDTYIELDIGAQTLYYVSGGKVSFSTPVVTGCVKDGFGTPRGVYYVFAKSTDVKLKGENKDKTKYETPVNYWMPITTGGIGFHDATWRAKFGKDIYIRDGSHGCINMPLDYAKSLYHSISVGVPVVIY